MRKNNDHGTHIHNSRLFARFVLYFITSFCLLLGMITSRDYKIGCKTKMINLLIVHPYANPSVTLKAIKHWGIVCDHQAQLFNVSLMLYWMGDGEKAEYLKILQIVRQLGYSTCFQRFLYKRYHRIKKYPEIVSDSFYSLVINLWLSHEWRYFFWMEPDTIPIRQFWLNLLEKQINKYDFIISGSIYRGNEHNSDIKPWQGHINGNAIYHLTAELIELIQCALKRPKSLYFDVNIYLELMNWIFDAQDSNSWRRYQTFAPKYLFSDFIINIVGDARNISLIRSLVTNNTIFLHGSPTSMGQKILDARRLKLEFSTSRDSVTGRGPVANGSRTILERDGPRGKVTP
jgi:hypothetical protein